MMRLRKKRKCKEMEEEHPYLKDLQKDESWTYFVVSVDPYVINRTHLPTNIDYKPPADDRAAKLDFSTTINRELLLCGITNREGNLAIRRDRLKKILTCQSNYFYIRKAIDRYEATRSKRKILVIQAIPCVLRLHNRVTEKIFYDILKKGYSLRTTNTDKQEFIDSVNSTLNTVVLGSEYSVTGWKFPMTENNNDISAKLSLTDPQAK